jgi:uncharacterized membrane protein YfcA
MEIAISLFLGFCAGVFSGLLGVGGGSILVPGMVYLLGTSQHVAHGTSLAVILASAFIGGITYYKKGMVDGKIALLLGIGATAGSVGGASVMAMLPADLLRRAFGAFIVIVGIKLLMERDVR